MTAIYARQSADRADSISIETQIDHCRRIIGEAEAEVFSDRGFSGANTKRPAFMKMIDGCREGRFSRVVTYKLDRISRSLLDFVILLEELEKLDIELISCTESFSSRSEMGILIMKLLIMFAEMERKNIRSRVRDNYYARGEKGFYLGGYPPFGYKKVPAVIDGKATSGYETDDASAEIVKTVFEEFASGAKSLSAICSQLNSMNITTSRNCTWSPSTLSRLLRNPFYVCADWKIYEFFTRENAIITSPPESFDGIHGCLCYGDKNKRNRPKFKSFCGEHITVGRHKGIISADLWLKARSRLESSKFAVSEGSVKSYLTGIAVCGSCGRKYSVTSSKGITYLYCRSKKIGGCTALAASVRSDLLEDICEAVIIEELKRLSELPIKSKTTSEENKLRIQLAQNSSKIEQLEENLLRVSDISVQVFDNAIKKLYQEREKLMKKLETEVAKNADLCYTELYEAARLWAVLPNRIRRLIAKQIIESCEISAENIVIRLK